MSTNQTQMASRRATFAQLDLAASEHLAKLNQTSSTAVTLLLAVVSRLGTPGGVVMATRAVLAEIMGDVSQRTVDRALAVLIKHGYVQRIRVGTAVGLAVNARVAWTGPRGELVQRAAFQATVIAGRGEQDPETLNPPKMQRVPVLDYDEIPVPTGSGLPPPSQPALKGLEPVLYRDKEGRMYELDSKTGELQQRLAEYHDAFSGRADVETLEHTA